MEWEKVSSDSTYYVPRTKQEHLEVKKNKTNTNLKTENKVSLLKFKQKGMKKNIQENQTEGLRMDGS